MTTFAIVLAIVFILIGLYSSWLINQAKTSYEDAKKHGTVEEWEIDFFGLKEIKNEK